MLNIGIAHHASATSTLDDDAASIQAVIRCGNATAHTDHILLWDVEVRAREPTGPGTGRAHTASDGRDRSSVSAGSIAFGLAGRSIRPPPPAIAVAVNNTANTRSIQGPVDVLT